MFEDEKDDAISQLFLRSERNLEKDLPSAGLWARIEKKLDQEAASPLQVVKAPTTAGNVGRWNPRYWLAAASVAACLLSAVAVWRMFDMSPQEKTLAAMDTQKSAQPTATATNKDISAELAINNIEKEAAYKSEDSAIAAKISSSTVYADPAVEPQKQAKPIVLSPVFESPSAVTITQSPTKLDLPTPSPVAPITDIVKDDRRKSSPSIDDSNAGISADDVVVNNASVQSNRYILPPTTQADNENLVLAEKNISTTAEERDFSDIAVTNKSSGAIRSRTQAEGKAKKKGVAEREDKKIASPTTTTTMAKGSTPTPSSPSASFDKINPRLSIFIWLVGKWSENRHDGISYEEWQIKNRNTLTGKGYKIKDGDKLFEENMTIFFDERNQQTYLSLSVDDYKEPIVYTLSRSVGDELVFTRDIQGTYPERIVFQRTKEGYAMIFANEKAELSITQQTFLQHRNAVNNHRATRNLTRSNAVKVE
jgi:hypothetical protein